MANTKSAKKRIRTNERKHERNVAYKSQVKTAVRKAEQAIFAGEPDQALLSGAFSILDKAAVKGIIHKNNAARRKSRLAAKFAAATSTSEA